MKVVHIALTDGGGAGMGMMTLHRALLAQGIDSKVLVAIKRCNDAEVMALRPNLHIWGKARWMQFLQRAACRLGLCLTSYDKWHRRIFRVRKNHPVGIYSMPITQYDVLRHPVVKAADVIHLHFAADFVDFLSFFAHVDKPVVWTIRDENPALGGFHFTTDKTKLYTYYAPIEDAFVDIKRKAVKQCKQQLLVVLLSRTTEARFQQTDYLACHRHQIIYNPISADCYQPHDKAWARQQLNLAADDVVLSFTCVHLADERKGLRLVLDAIKLIDNKHIKLLCVGQANEQLLSSLPPNVMGLGMVDEQRLSVVYSASDLFINASAQETFGKTIVEALYCGTPVVSTAVGIAPEAVDNNNGVICPTHSAQAIAQGIEQALATTYDGASIRKKAIQMFDAKRIARQYEGVYRALLAET